MTVDVKPRLTGWTFGTAAFGKDNSSRVFGDC